ncbi:hypothetical protein GCM10010172_80260 [Paractinoplanes ferrugineus]|uniref:Uncharacterized protein n=1 Tax=Paractinoplanes ferrugineus TaxID=113564 RepID=A0A919MQW2_9ACTN|nr:hypothetical protein [Actinoplanes ferrugineus]GIE16742.1 hypothetical protein Afe05nite_85820 [Actinoplanes ferrugineus]
MSGITVNDHVCWVLTYPSGPSEFEPHYDTEDKALKAAAEDDNDNRGTPKRLDQPCATATSACGYSYDEDEFVEHWPDAGELKQHLRGLDYRFLGDGTLLCPAGVDCDECDALAPAVVEPELPGQMSIGEVNA